MTIPMTLHEGLPSTTQRTYGQGILELESGYYMGWGTLALLNAGIAQGKNRSGLNWFLLSVFLGPLATFFLVLCDKLPSSG